MNSVLSRNEYLLLFLAADYALLFWLFLRFLVADACLDAGGVFEAGSCLSARPGEYLPLLERPWTFWLVAFVVPALPVAVGGFFTLWLLEKGSWRSPSAQG